MKACLAEQVCAVIGNRVRTLPWDQILADVQPFLEPGADTQLLTRENVLQVLKG